ncbi:MAG: threonylcarbamoyl-AMP synthase [Chlorobiaceae bacterium]|jgi:L-threonylcarbamoyladenylate synthase|nr:threonylcarbamoyl-AMP synthase [Chlorobiaceae bacterium]
MQTIITDSPEEAAEILNAGNVVAFPTETVYGLGACICHPEAVKHIFIAKGRPSDNPLIVHVADTGQIGDVAVGLNEYAVKLIERFFPGPLTVVLQKNPHVPDSVTAGLDTVGVRCPSDPVAHEFLRRACCPVAAPSANISGIPSSTNWETVYKDLAGKISCILRGNPSKIGLESTIVDCTGPVPLLLRTGAVTLEQLQEVVPETIPATHTEKNVVPKSPGLKYPHYAPAASIVLIRHGETVTAAPHSAYIGREEPPKGISIAKSCRSLEEYGKELFSFFRQCDAEGIRVIYCELPENCGLGRAIRDRLQRAAGE